MSPPEFRCVASCICVVGKARVSDPQKWISGTSEYIGSRFENGWHTGQKNYNYEHSIEKSFKT